MSTASGAASRQGAWLDLLRLPVVFSAWSNILAAHLIATAGSPHWRLLWLQLAITTCLFAAGTTLNDCFDRDRDRRDKPERPLPSGRIAPAAAWGAGFGLLAAGVLLGATAGLAPLLVVTALAATLIAYDAGLKRGALGPPVMGLGRALNWLLGLSAAPALAPYLLLTLPVFLYAMSTSLLRRAESAGGRRRAVLPATVMLGVALAAALVLYPLGILTDPYALALTALTGALLLRRLLRLMDDPTPARVRASTEFMLLCMVPLDALLLGGDGQRLAALALLLLLLPGWFLAWRMQAV
ncbi:MAG: UbiA family prenyltransferase [Thiohalocapsa sp.]|uniref:UbiA family prenyltransferase n=1 Tax=Thiohalocapsa sp. TaxID=2497641 RepID=UPI0025D4D6D0|nr:UbiA family prenyltransferase [Thiohalocapsa sp.]MCG6941435.1 UbiA family prenyltransferase [Thiohalocapsa sp.]